MNKIIIVGAGMAGSEAAWQAAQRGIQVELYEMRPVKSTPAHKTEYFIIENSNLQKKANTAQGFWLIPTRS